MAPRTRIWLVVGVAAVAAATVTALVAARAERTAHASQLPSGAPRLFLDLGVRTDAEARTLRRGGTLYNEGKRKQAGTLFERYGSAQARVGAAFARWPAGTLAKVEGLSQVYPGDSFVLLHVGLARLWSGDTTGALTAWKRAERAQPDTLSALKAEDFLHPQLPPGEPVFVPSFPLPDAVARLSAPRQLAALRALARGSDVHARILYGVALAQLGQRVSAERELAAAARLAPNDPEPLTAAAVLRFDKEHPARAFAKLGPLSQRFPRAATVRFHLGLCLLWLEDVAKAREEFQLAVRDEPHSPLAAQAQRLLAKLPAG